MVEVPVAAGRPHELEPQPLQQSAEIFERDVLDMPPAQPLQETPSVHAIRPPQVRKTEFRASVFAARRRCEVWDQVAVAAAVAALTEVCADCMLWSWRPRRSRSRSRPTRSSGGLGAT